MPSRVAVRPADDPFKKYWWLILAFFGLTAGWLLLPMMETSVGSTRVATSAPAEGMPVGEGSLDGSDNPSGAPGSALDLSMDVSRPRKADGAVMSSLYQAPDEPALAQAPTSGAAAEGAALASALQKAASSDPSGWGGQKAQKGFTQPKLGGSMPGLGGGGGGSSGSFGASSSIGSFGSRNAEVGYQSTRGLSGSVSDLPEAKGVKGLARTAQQVQAAAGQRSNDAKVGGLSGVFDGRSASPAMAGIGAGGAALSGSGAYDSLDDAPINLKANDPDLDKREFKAPPAKVANSKDNRSEEFKQQIAMMVVTTVVGGMVSGVAGTIITNIGTQLMQMNKTKERGEGTEIGKKS